ncbi:regulator [Acetobacter pasteurianus]|uniref:Two-component response regulator n=5 Tax=Acetobacter pasteurianus TaxID=438 RepID=A0A401WSZ6_ACEPA|nr:response regulator [Acetobacter pasteurianus]BAU38326.1 two-component response regulator [Acetobacter pasteurianus NBRC 101655]ASC07092.1 Phyllosphere-induced regulator PhyR [Acetobacter pasteurianus subsp. pasteurianus]OAZ73133.1 Phyllosphere-induced regulator PhyR [Acetobacter pasteurianus]RCL09747.1 regulator [Acetobacter pasteurianus]WKC16695.1 response regulator [Acetobacter pasteurianus]
MSESLRDGLIRALPYGRRYARALTGSQPEGDLLVAESLRGLSAQRLKEGFTPLYQLYEAISGLFSRKGFAAEYDVAGLSVTQRQLLLLITLEEVPVEMAARITGVSTKQAEQELEDAQGRLHKNVQTSVLIIEDEPIIAMDIEQLVLQCGHQVAGIAHTQADAVKLARETKPGLILADINLGPGGDGIQAVAEITSSFNVPVIYVTAYPERLLTGETMEPSFVITKPFDPLTLAVATYQAVSSARTQAV